MNEEVINDLYSNAVSKGYKKSREEFVSLLNSNDAVLNDMYSYVQSKGYKKGVDDFKLLVGATSPMAERQVASKPVEPVKKKDTVSPFVDGGSELTRFDPRTGQVVQETPTFTQPSVKPEIPQQTKPAETIMYGPMGAVGLQRTKEYKPEYEGKSLPKVVGELGKTFAKGVVKFPADVLETAAIATTAARNLAAKTGLVDESTAAQVGVQIGGANVNFFQAANEWKNLVNEYVPTDKDIESGFWGQSASALGQMVPIILTGGMSGGARAIAKEAGKKGLSMQAVANYGKNMVSRMGTAQGVVTISQVAAPSYEQAKREGATENEAIGYALQNAIVSYPIEMLPVNNLFKRLDNVLVGNKGVEVLKRAVIGGGEEAITEGVQNVYENVTADAIYGTTRGFLDGVGEATAVGGTVGAIMNGVLTALLGRRARATSTEEIQEIDKSIEDVEQKIDQVKSNNESIKETVKVLEETKPRVLSYGSANYNFIESPDGNLEYTDDALTEQQAQGVVSNLTNSYKKIDFKIEEVEPEDPYQPTTYRIIGTPKTTQQDAIQEQAAGQVPIQPGTRDRQEMAQGEPQAEPQGVAEEGQAQEEVDPLKDVESTTNALASALRDTPGIINDRDSFNTIYDIVREDDLFSDEREKASREGGGISQRAIAEKYHESKANGTNPDFVQVVENAFIRKTPTQEVDVEGEVSRLEQLFAEQETAPTVSAGVSISSDADVEELINRTKSKSQQATTQEEKESVDTRVKIIDTAKKAINTLKSVFPDVDIVIHDDEGSYNAAMADMDGASGTRGNFSYEITPDGKTTGRIDINLSRANSRTVAHEVAHGILFKTFGENANLFNDFRTRLSKVLKGDANKKLNEFADKYVDPATGQLLDVNHEEFLAELTGMLEQQETNISVSTMQKVAALINEFVSKITGGKFKPFEDTKNTKDVVDFFNTISGAIREGSEIQQLNSQEPYSSGVAIPVSNPQEFVGKKFKSQVDIGDYKFPSGIDILTIADLPIKTLTELVRQYEGRVLIITSDATGYGVDRNGDPILGGFGFASNKKNVDDGIGFASVSTGTVRGTYTAAEKAYGTGKTLVLVMIQPPHTTINNSYGAKYILRGLKEIAASSKEELAKTKDAIKSFIKGSKAIQNELKNDQAALKRGSEKRLFDLIDSIDENTNLEEAVKEFLNDTTFTIRKELGKGIILENKNIRTNKSTNYSKIALNNVGYNIYDFLKEYGDNTFLTDDLILNNTGGYVVGGFELDVLPKEQREALINDIQGSGIVHPLFNAKLPGTNHFRLDGLYDVQENFAEYAKPDTEISLSKEERDALVREIYKDDKFYKAEARSIPLDKRSYTNLTVPAKTEFKDKYLKQRGLLTEATPNVPTKVAKGEGFIPREGAAEQIAKGKFVSRPQAEATPKSKRVSKSQIVGENAQLEAVVRHNLRVAKILSREGLLPERIKLVTFGWELGPDGKWRYEIPDGKFKENIDISSPSKLSDIFDAPDLYKAYPEARNIEVEFKLLPEKEFGNFSPDTGSIIINRSKYKNDRAAAELTMLHEIQHWIQVKELFQGGSSPVQAEFKMKKIVDYFEKLVKKRESIYDSARLFYSDNQEVVKEAKELLDFAKSQYDIVKELTFEKGTKEEKAKAAEMIKNLSEYVKRGIPSAQNLIDELSKKNPAEAYNLYYRIAGEVEARNVEYRNKLTPSQRRYILFSDTENIDRDDQIMIDSFDFVFQADEMKNEFRVSKSQLDDQDRINKLINDARAQGFSEEAIILFLQRKGLTDKVIDTAMAKAEPAAKKVEVTEEFAPGYNRVLNEIFGKKGIVARSRERGRSEEETMQNAINYLEQDTKVYENATDVQREAMVRNLRKEFKKREKAAPSAEKVVGKPKKQVTVDEMAALKDQIKLEARAAREAKGDLNAKRKALAARIIAARRKGSITSNQARTLVNRISKVNLDNPIMVERLLEYTDKVFDNANYAADMAELRKLQNQARSRNHTSMGNLVDRFTSINPELIPLVDKKTGEPLTVIQDYKEALDFLNNRTPSYERMNKMLSTIESYQVSDPFDAVKTIDDIKEKYKGIRLNEVKNVEQYVALIKDINSIKRKLYQLLENESISQEEYDIQITLIGKDQAAVEKKYAERINKIKSDLISEIKKQRPKTNTEFTKEENVLIKEYLELSDADLESLSPEELFILNDLLENIRNGEIDVFRFGNIVSKASKNKEGIAVGKQLKESKLSLGSAELRKKMAQFESSFWEGLLGLGRATSGPLQKFIISPFNRAIGSYEKFLRDGNNDFLKLKNKYKIDDSKLFKSTKQMHKIGMLTTYLQEHMAQFDPKNKGIDNIGKRDWFNEILASETMRDDYSPEELKIIEEIYKSLPKDKDGKVNPKAVYDSYDANDGKFFTKNEKAFFDEVMKWKKENSTSKQKAANEMNGNPFSEIPFHMLRSRYGSSAPQIAPSTSGDNGMVRIKAGTGKERVSEAVGAINTNFEKLFIKGLEQTGRDYFLSKALKDINNVLASAKKELDGDKDPLVKAISYTLSDALAYEFSDTTSQNLLKRLVQARAAMTLFDPIRAGVEFTSTLLSFGLRARTLSGYKNLFGSQGDMKNLLEFTDSPLRLRQNINNAIDINDGRIEPQGMLMKWTTFLSGLPERTMMVTSWMPTFTNEFQNITGEKFDMKKFNDSEAYREKYGKAIKDASAVADAQTEKIIGPTTKAGQRRDIIIFPGKTVGRDTVSGQILGFFSNYPYREITEFVNGFREAGEVLKKGDTIDALKQLQKPLGISLNVAAYGLLSSVVYASRLILLGDDEEEKRGEKLLEELMTTKGFIEETAANAAALAASKYAGGGRAILQLLGTLGIMLTDNEETKATIKKMLKGSVYVDPLPTQKLSGFGTADRVNSAIIKYIPQFVVLSNLILDGMGAVNEFKTIIDKVQN
jgi:predicted SprT family Zn-dependent metalloprotease